MTLSGRADWLAEIHTFWYPSASSSLGCSAKFIADKYDRIGAEGPPTVGIDLS